MRVTSFQKPAGKSTEEWTVSIMHDNHYSIAEMEAQMVKKLKANGGTMCVPPVRSDIKPNRRIHFAESEGYSRLTQMITDSHWISLAP